MPDYHSIGWTRSGKNKGMVIRYHLKKVCNTITSFSGGGHLQGPSDGNV